MAPVVLTIVSSDLEAEMLCGELRANGIKCAYEKTEAGAAIGAALRTSQVGPTSVFVDETQLEEARTFLPDAR